MRSLAVWKTRVMVSSAATVCRYDPLLKETEMSNAQLRDVTTPLSWANSKVISPASGEKVFHFWFSTDFSTFSTCD